MGENKKTKSQFERTFEVTDNLNRAAWKLQGIAGILFREEAGSICISDVQANGLNFLLEQIAEDIKTNANLITEVAA